MTINRPLVLHTIMFNMTGQNIEIDLHFIKEKIETGLITSIYIPYGHQLAYVLTKSLPTKRLSQLACNLGMIDIHSPVSERVL